MLPEFKRKPMQDNPGNIQDNGGEVMLVKLGMG